MRKKVKPVRVRNSKELVNFLGLSPVDLVEIEFRARINDKIIDVVNHQALTHKQVAELASTSRTKITAIMNRNTADISSDLMLRVLASLGFVTKVSFRKAS